MAVRSFAAASPISLSWYVPITSPAFRKCKPPCITSSANCWRVRMATELYGTSGCPHTQDMREWLEWYRREFEEYDVEADPAALARMREITGGQLMVPVLVEDGKAT